MNLGLKEKVVLVTGASKGIGKAIAAAFAAEGSSVVLNARNQQDLEQAVQEIQQRGGSALALAADVPKAAFWLIQSHQPLSGLHWLSSSLPLKPSSMG